MILANLIVVFVTLISSIQASLAPRTTLSYSNKTSATSTASSTHTTDICCFVIQETVSEVWWQETSYSSTYDVVNLTSITTFLTLYPNGTVTNVHTNILTTNASFEFTFLVGINPITNFINNAPGPTELDTDLNGTAIVTGGVTVHSPAAFYEYSTVKIITAAAVTDSHGHKVCGTPSSFTNSVSFYGANTDLPVFQSINSNAEAYFGGLDIAGITSSPTHTTTETDTFSWTDPPSTEIATLTLTSYSTYYVNSLGKPIPPGVTPTGVIISLTTPFIYQPTRGAKGEDDEGQHCLQSSGTENYGYVPQTLLDFLVSNEQYSSQYPGLSSCLPGGPSIIQITSCESILPSVQYAGGDLTSSTVVIVTPPAAPKTQHQGTPSVPPATSPPNSPPASTAGPPPANPTPIPSSNSPPNSSPNRPQSSPPNPLSSNPAQPPASNSPAPPPSTPSLGSIINSIIGGQPANTPSPQNSSPVVIPNPTTIPLNQAPPGLTGLTTTVSGQPYIIVSSATTLPVQPTAQTYSTTLISGTPYILIPGPTNIPLTVAPSGLTGITSMISGTLVLVVPSSTSVLALPPLPGSMTVIGGTTELVITGPATIPVVSGVQLTGSTTVISGTTMVVVSGTQTATMTGAGVLPSYVQVSEATKRRDLRAWGVIGVVLGFLLSLR